MRPKRMIISAVLTLFYQFLVIFPASAAGFSDDPVLPPAGQVTIDVVTVNGSGCRPGSAAVVIPPDNSTFTMSYSEYLARVGVGAAPVDFRKNCQLNLFVHPPEGFTYTIARVDHRGYASLAAGATAMQRTSYYFSGMPSTDFRMHDFSGAFEDNWHTVDEIDIGTAVYHPCGALRNLNINTELRVRAGISDPATTTSFMAMDSTDSATYYLHWRRCP